MEKAAGKGHYLAGFLSYEAGYAFEPSLREKDAFDFPLLCFGIYSFSSKRNLRLNAAVKPEETATILSQVSVPKAFNLSKSEYFSKIESIRSYISSGETYQITFCVKKKFAYNGDPYALYEKLLDFQWVPYPAFIRHKDFSLLSLSPEMFLKKDKDKIVVKPMKGTLVRDGSLINNIFGKMQLHFDPKNRAENVMIADLLRNDLGRICRGGSVVTPKLFEVDRYRTLYQMTSTVKGRLNAEIPFYDIFAALFPSGSVTGAPKIRAMQLIRELESEERHIYTGAIGYITPDRNMFFNVPIRTSLLIPSNPFSSLSFHAEMGIGGGITWYSTAEGEYEECEIKASFLNTALL